MLGSDEGMEVEGIDVGIVVKLSLGLVDGNSLGAGSTGIRNRQTSLPLFRATFWILKPKSSASKRRVWQPAPTLTATPVIVAICQVFANSS